MTPQSSHFPEQMKKATLQNTVLYLKHFGDVKLHESIGIAHSQGPSPTLSMSHSSKALLPSMTKGILHVRTKIGKTSPTRMSCISHQTIFISMVTTSHLITCRMKKIKTLGHFPLTKLQLPDLHSINVDRLLGEKYGLSSLERIGQHGTS